MLIREWVRAVFVWLLPYAIAALGLFLFVSGAYWLLLTPHPPRRPGAFVDINIKEWVFGIWLSIMLFAIGGLAVGSFIARFTSLSRGQVVLVTFGLAAGEALFWIVALSSVHK